MPVSRERMETLARQEHDRWMNDLVRDGWTYSSGAKDPERKTHPLLVGWDDLDEPEREKDRDAIRAIPRMLARVGYALDVPPALDEDRDVPQPGGGRLGEIDVGQQLVHAHEATQLTAHLDDLGGLGVAESAVLRQRVQRRAVEVEQPAVVVVARARPVGRRASTWPRGGPSRPAVGSALGCHGGRGRTPCRRGRPGAS